MRRCLAVLVCGVAVLAAADVARADHAPVIAVPSRPGVPVIINGVDASYAIVEGDWGLSRPGHGNITIIGGAPVYDPGYRRAYPRYGHPPPRGRHEVELGPHRPLPEPVETYSRFWSTQPEPVPNYGRPPATITDPATFNQPLIVAPGGRYRYHGRRIHPHP